MMKKVSHRELGNLATQVVSGELGFDQKFWGSRVHSQPLWPALDKRTLWAAAQVSGRDVRSSTQGEAGSEGLELCRRRHVWGPLVVAQPRDIEESSQRTRIDLYFCMFGSVQCLTVSTESLVTSTVPTYAFDSGGYILWWI